MKSITRPYPDVVRYEDEKHFINTETNENEKFPSLNDEPSLSLSVIVPAYDEEQRRKWQSE